MKLQFFLMMLLPVMVAGADTAPLSGTWQLHNNIAGNESDFTCTFVQKDKELTGTCSSDHGPVNITGKVDDKKVNWVYKSEYNGGPITLTYSGGMDATGKISGTVTVEEYTVDGDFTAVQAK